MRTVEVSGLPIGDGHPPRIMSVLNMSSESGYKPSVYTDPDRAAAVVDEELVPAGADIIDVGLQSANPKYETLPPETELERLEAAAEMLDFVESDTIFAIETRYAEVAEAAIGAGFDIVNDVCGFADPEMRPVCEAHDIPVIKMASPPDLERPGAIKTTDDVFEAMRRDGFTDRTIIDPAFGGWYDDKTFEDNWDMFRRLREFRAFNRPILTATNREDFLGDLAGRPDTENQLAVSLAAATLEVARGSHVIRTHDTRDTYDVVQVAHKLAEPRTTTTGAANVSELTGVSGRETHRHLDLNDRATSTAGRGSHLSFSLTGLSAGEAESIERTASAASLLAAVSEDQAFLSGSVAAFQGFLEELPEDTDALEAVAQAVGESIHREHGSN